MEIQLESAEPHAIRSYSSHSIEVNNQTITQSCIVTNTSIQTHWPIQNVEKLTPSDLEPLIQSAPEIIIIGHNTLQRPSPIIASYLSTQNIGFECMSLGAACRTFNILLSEKRAVVLGIIL
ncbi:MAG TPA: MTH938/NDUFAF3 family protein [Legionellaceae bacterium]|nr:MTH938/NDUFAF3 family protein [Legionellaceae bacterium]